MAEAAEALRASAAHPASYSSLVGKKATRKPRALALTTAPPYSCASGNIVESSMVKIAPAAKDWIVAITLSEAPARNR